MSSLPVDRANHWLCHGDVSCPTAWRRHGSLKSRHAQPRGGTAQFGVGVGDLPLDDRGYVDGLDLDQVFLDGPYVDTQQGGVFGCFAFVSRDQ